MQGAIDQAMAQIQRAKWAAEERIARRLIGTPNLTRVIRGDRAEYRVVPPGAQHEMGPVLGAVELVTDETSACVVVSEP